MISTLYTAGPRHAVNWKQLLEHADKICTQISTVLAGDCSEKITIFKVTLVTSLKLIAFN